MMDLIVLLIALDIIASKFLDCYVSSIGVQNIHLERNSITKKITDKIGIRYNNWFHLLVTIFVVNIVVLLMYTTFSSLIYQLLFVFTGLFVTALNLGAAHSNYYGKKNFITAILLR